MLIQFIIYNYLTRIHVLSIRISPISSCSWHCVRSTDHRYTMQGLGFAARIDHIHAWRMYQNTRCNTIHSHAHFHIVCFLSGCIHYNFLCYKKNSIPLCQSFEGQFNFKKLLLYMWEFHKSLSVFLCSSCMSIT